MQTRHAVIIGIAGLLTAGALFVGCSPVGALSSKSPLSENRTAATTSEALPGKFGGEYPATSTEGSHEWVRSFDQLENNKSTPATWPDLSARRDQSGAGPAPIYAKAQKDASARETAQRSQQNRAVDALIADSRRLTAAGRYQEALKVVDQILIIDPQNDYARGVSQILFDRATLNGPRRVQRDEVPSESLPAPSEELWIISKPQPQNPPAPSDDTPPSGALMAERDKQLVPCPLQHTDVKARIDAYIASVDVTQQYANPFDEKIEADYLFPLPENAAVNEFVMQVGDRTIRGIIREREEAKQIYQAARAQGYTASLLEQQRPNVFQQKVANIEPGKKIDIHIRYFHTLQYVDGWYEFDFPMVVAPRFNPPGFDNGIAPVARGNTAPTGQPVNAQYLAPTERSGHDISLTVDLNAGVKIEEIKSINHRVDEFRGSKDPWEDRDQITLASSDTLPNKDFVLRWRVAGGELKTNVMAQPDKDGGGYFALLLVPPATNQDLPRRPVDLCFVLDVSGSMSGRPIEQSKAAMRAALQSMQQGDTFEVMTFANATQSLSERPLPATPQNIAAAMQFVQNSSAGGGTMMLDGITKALNVPTDESRTRYLCLLSDGQIGNESQLIQATRALHNQTHVFGFGVGSSPNRYLFDGMSRAGAGAVAYLSLNERGEDVMNPFFDRIAKPALSNITLDTTGLAGCELTNTKIPDCYVGRAVVITGRYKGDGGTIKLHGNLGGVAIEKTFSVKATADLGRENNSALASVWARQQIAAVCDRSIDDAMSDAPAQIKSIALQYGLMSQYTSYVAVDSSHVTAGDHGVSVAQPLPIPDGERYDTQVTRRQ